MPGAIRQILSPAANTGHCLCQTPGVAAAGNRGSGLPLAAPVHGLTNAAATNPALNIHNVQFQ